MTLRESLAAELAAPGPQPPGARRTRQAAPKGFEPGVRYNGGIPVEVTTDAIAHLSTEDEWRAAVEGMGITLPEGWRLVLVEARFDPAAWTRENQGEDAVTRPVWRYRFRVEQLLERGGHVDDLLASIERWKPRKPVTTATDGDTFVVVVADTQIGESPRYGDQGTPRTIERVLALTDQAIAEYRALARRGLAGPVAILLAADGCQGMQSQNGKLTWRTDLTMTEMVRVYKRLIHHVITEFARIAPAVAVLVVGGNHDQAMRQVETRPDDSWDIAAASDVYDRLSDQPEKFSHVAWHFPRPDTDIVTADLSGTIVALAHGHQMKGGAEKWWAGQAHGKQPAGEADVLVSGHYHNLRVVSTGGGRTWLQAPSLDNGSPWYTRQTGDAAPSGLLTFTVGRGGWDRLRVLTWEGDQP